MAQVVRPVIDDTLSVHWLRSAVPKDIYLLARRVLCARKQDSGHIRHRSVSKYIRAQIKLTKDVLYIFILEHA